LGGKKSSALWKGKSRALEKPIHLSEEKNIYICEEEGEERGGRLLNEKVIGLLDERENVLATFTKQEKGAWKRWAAE